MKFLFVHERFGALASEQKSTVKLVLGGACAGTLGELAIGKGTPAVRSVPAPPFVMHCNHHAAAIRNLMFTPPLSAGFRIVPSSQSPGGDGRGSNTPPPGGDNRDGAQWTKLALPIFAISVGLPLLACFSSLRETPIFWRNEGGCPVWLTVEFSAPVPEFAAA